MGEPGESKAVQDKVRGLVRAQLCIGNRPEGFGILRYSSSTSPHPLPQVPSESLDYRVDQIFLENRSILCATAVFVDREYGRGHIPHLMIEHHQCCQSSPELYLEASATPSQGLSTGYDTVAAYPYHDAFLARTEFLLAARLVPGASVRCGLDCLTYSSNMFPRMNCYDNTF